MGVVQIWADYGPNVWFKSTIENDRRVTMELGNFLLNLNDINNINSRDELLDTIILTDQVARHVHRNDESKIESYGSMSVILSKKFMEDFKPDNCFELLHITLPLRHWPNDDHIKIVMNLYDEFVCNYPNHEDYVVKLRKTTTKRYKLWLRKNVALKKDESGFIMESEILDKECCNNKKLNIDGLLEDACFAFFDKKFPRADSVLLSLSGGVDSMVLALLFLGIRKKHNINIHAFHFNYLVRKESTAEELYLQSFCDANDIPFHCAQIDKTDPNLSANWDSASKNQRYSHYKNVIRKIYNGDLNDIPIILGHHMDDVEENLLMNLFNTGSCNGSRCLWYDMSGMSPIHHINGVRVYRPLVDMKLRKDWVINLAKKYRVPYFRDTSFELATRIRVRRELVPLMQDIFGNKVNEQISKVDTQSKEIESLIQNKIKTELTNKQLTLHINDIVNSGLSNAMMASAMLDTIKAYLYDNNRNIPTQKSLLYLVDLIQNNKRETFKTNLRENYFAYFERNKMILKFVLT